MFKLFKKKKPHVVEVRKKEPNVIGHKKEHLLLIIDEIRKRVEGSETGKFEIFLEERTDEIRQFNLSDTKDYNKKSMKITIDCNLYAED